MLKWKIRISNRVTKKIIIKHNIYPKEVFEAVAHESSLLFKIGKKRYALYSQTSAGRYLFIVLLAPEKSGAPADVRTAIDMSPSQIKFYKRRRHYRYGKKTYKS